MKILLDANISWKLVNKLNHIYGECNHVDHIGLTVPVKDIDIWNYAHKNGHVIITKDSDFMDLLDTHGFPPKIVLLRTGNNNSQALLDLLISIKEKIDELVESDIGILEIINRTQL